MKFLKLSALSFLIIGTTHVVLLNLSAPQDSKLVWVASALADDDEYEYDDDDYYRYTPRVSQPVQPRRVTAAVTASTTAPATPKTKTTCSTVYDTVTGASGSSKKVARKVCKTTPVLTTPTPVLTTPTPVPVAPAPDTKAPLINISAPKNRDKVPYTTTQIAVKGTILDNKDPWPIFEIRNTATPNEVLKDFGFISLKEGTNTITVWVKDNAGNQAQKEVTVFRASAPAKTAPVPATPTSISITTQGTGAYKYEGGAVVYTIALTKNGKQLTGEFLNWQPSPVFTKAQAQTMLTQMIQRQQANVDSVTGATGSSEAIKSAFVEAWNNLVAKAKTINAQDLKTITPPTPALLPKPQVKTPPKAVKTTPKIIKTLPKVVPPSLPKKQPVLSKPITKSTPTALQQNHLAKEKVIAQYLANLKIKSLAAKPIKVALKQPTQPSVKVKPKVIVPVIKPKPKPVVVQDTKTKAS